MIAPVAPPAYPRPVPSEETWRRASHIAPARPLCSRSPDRGRCVAPHPNAVERPDVTRAILGKFPNWGKTALQGFGMRFLYVPSFSTRRGLDCGGL
jgi:hypothetical protein